MRPLITLCVAALLFSACSKKSGSDYIDCFKNFHLTPKDSVIYAGDDVTIYASSPEGIFDWAGPGGFSDHTSSDGNYITIKSIKITQSGWYYCGVSGPECNPASDSVYIHVRFPKGTPPCSVADNTITNTIGLPDINSPMVQRGFDVDLNSVSLSVYQGIGYQEIYFFFNTGGKNEPQDGVYTTKNIGAFDGDDDANTVNVACNYFPFYLVSLNGQKVYVSHVNGKLRVAFCSLSMQDAGASGTMSGQVTEK
jgi:hypothetical protein